MAPRSNWKGYLKLSLVSASIAIYPATSSSEKVRFNTLNRATGNRLKRQMVDSVTGEEVESDQMIGLAEDIIDKMTGVFEPEKFDDRYENAMIELIRSKQAGLPAKVEKAPARSPNVVNLMDALKRSIGETTGKKAPTKSKAVAEPAASKPKRKAAKG